MKWKNGKRGKRGWINEWKVGKHSRANLLEHANDRTK